MLFQITSQHVPKERDVHDLINFWNDKFLGVYKNIGDILCTSRL